PDLPTLSLHDALPIFSVTARGLDDKQAPIDIDKGDFEMAIQAWGSSAHPHPHFSFVTDLFVHNIPIAKNQGGKGYGFPLQDVKRSEEHTSELQSRENL